MTSTPRTLVAPARSSRVYYGWIVTLVAALAMVGTLPGRTQGLGLVTEPLLRDFGLDRSSYATINLWATLIGALGSLGVGRVIDRAGSRGVLTAIALLLGLVVIGMSMVTSVAMLALTITLTRALGQSALSVVSITMVGQWFRRRLNAAMAVYAIVLSMGFMIAFPLVGALVADIGWRRTWMIVGLTLIGVLAPLAAWLVRRAPESIGLALDGDERAADGTVSGGAADAPLTGASWTRAVRTPAFWVFAIGSSTYGLVSSGITLFNESILLERGFDQIVFRNSLAVVAITGLFGNFLGGWLADRWSMGRVMAITMFTLMIALLVLPSVTTVAHVMGYATVMGLSGGFVTVLFFSFWSRAYGRRELGRIQGIAQAMTVLASAVGPLLLAVSQARTGSYGPFFYAIAACVGVMAVLAWIVPVPQLADVRE